MDGTLNVDPFPRVAGYCPMGCGHTLFLAVGGYVTCSFVQCPNPTAVSSLLEENQPNHVVVIDDETFTVRHPLHERILGVLEECDLHAYMVGLGGPPRQLGTYVVRPVGDVWVFGRKQ